MEQFDDLFGDLALDKPIEVEIEDKTLELEMRVEDLHSLMVLGQAEDPDEDDIERLTSTLRAILYRTYHPYYDETREQVPDELSKEKQREAEEAEKRLEQLLLKYYMDLFLGISEALGWQEGMDSDIDKQDFPEGSLQS